jgi:hypothetical protein
VLPASLHFTPTASEIFLTPVAWIYRALGAPILEAVCSTWFFAYGNTLAFPGGLWHSVGVNVMLVAYLTLAARVVAGAKRAARRCMPVIKLKSA